MRRVLLFALVLASSAAAAAQERPARVLPELDGPVLSSLVANHAQEIERCASVTETDTYVATVRARVSPGAPPSTLFGARIEVEVSSRPPNRAFERCVARSLREALRRATYAVQRTVTADHTFRIAERPEPSIDRPPPYDPREAHRLLAANEIVLQRCLGVAGVPERATLRVSVRPDGRLVLTSADVPAGAAPSALGCLASQIASLRVNGRPARSTTIVYALSVQSRAF